MISKHYAQLYGEDRQTTVEDYFLVLLLLKPFSNQLIAKWNL